MKLSLYLIIYYLVMKCYCPDDNISILIRIYGKKSEILINRKQELVVSLHLLFIQNYLLFPPLSPSCVSSILPHLSLLFNS